ncbi:hypothetical protein [Marinimicrobium alkaliphilum]|uniref:hypothetical protein n=1 Tax=Marinimicrobium alkaliphilum TaxID=2202654 RepID=UPI000DBA2B51|nr:hypothetical protein [Marinimicrobium alkaliphilum]
MDKDLPVRDICPLHLASLAQTGTLSEDKPPPQGAGRTLWLTLLASLVGHAILLALWAPRPIDVKAVAPKPSLRITFDTAVTDTAIAETVLEQDSPAAEEPVAAELPPPPEENTAVEEPTTPESPPRPESTAATEETTPDKPGIDIHTLDTSPHPLPATSESTPGNVFHPGLRNQISDARARRERLRNTERPDLSSWQDASGETWMDLGNGRCMRSAGDTHGTTSWELPTRCKGQLTEGESMLRSMQRTLDRR